MLSTATDNDESTGIQNPQAYMEKMVNKAIQVLRDNVSYYNAPKWLEKRLDEDLDQIGTYLMYLTGKPGRLFSTSVRERPQSPVDVS